MDEVILTEAVTISLADFLAMRDVYEKHKNKNYFIDLRVEHLQYVDDAGSIQKVSSLRTSNGCFPDDTDTLLTQHYKEVNENSDYLSFLEGKVGRLTSANEAYRQRNLDLTEKLAKRSLWSRIFN